MPSTRSQKREKDVEEVKEEPKVKKTKTKEKKKVETVPEVESPKKKGKKKSAEIESGKEEAGGGSVAQIVKITVEACNS